MTTQWCIRVTTHLKAASSRMARSRKRRAESFNHNRMPPLHMVRAFEAVARMGTMRRAADDIGISHTVISRHVRHLEAWLLQQPREETIEFVAKATTMLAHNFVEEQFFL